MWRISGIKSRPFRGVFISALVAMTLTVGCDLIAIEDAQQALETTREMQRIQDEEIRPCLAALDQLQQDEIEPREREIKGLARQSRVIYREKIEPLEQQLQSLFPDGETFSVLQQEFSARMRELEEEERNLENEGRQFEKQFHLQEEALRVLQETTIREKEEQAHSLRKQLEELYQNGWATTDSPSTTAREDSDAAPLRQRIQELEAEIARTETQLHDQTEGLERQLFPLEEELHKLYRNMEEQERQLYQSMEDHQRQFDSENWTLSQQFQEKENTLRALRETTILPTEELKRSIQMQLEQLYQNDWAYLETLHNELQMLHIKIAGIPADSPDADRVRQRIQELEAQISQNDNHLRAKAEGLEQQLHQLEQELRRLYLNVEEQERQLYQNRENLQRQFEEENWQLRQRFQEKEDALRTFYDTTIRPKEELMRSLQMQLENLPRNGWAPIEALHNKLEEIQVRGESQLHSQTQELEQQMFALEEEIHQLYQRMEAEMRALQEEFQQSMWSLDDRRYLLQDRWRVLEEEMQEKMGTVHIEVERERQKLQEQLAAINQLELHPLEEQIHQMELELEEFYEQERAQKLDLRAAKQNLGPMQQEMETRLLDLLESALSTLANEDVGAGSATNSSEE